MDDHGELRRVADRRDRHFRRTVLPVLVAVVVAVPVLTWLVIGGPVTPLRLAVAIVPTLVGVAAGLVAWRLLRRRGGGRALLDGADAATRRAVREAWRTGHAGDARIDALARGAARESVGTLRAQQGIFGVLLAVWVAMLGVRVVRGELTDTLPAALTTALFALVLALLTRQRRRAVRYLREGGPAAPRDRAA